MSAGGGRPEAPIDPAAGPIAAFAVELRELRERSGLTVRELADKANRGLSTISRAMGGKEFPSWEVTRAYVTACGAKESEWQIRWAKTCTALGRSLPADLLDSRGVPPDPAEASSPAEFVRQLALLRRWAGASYGGLNKNSGGRLPPSTVSGILRGDRLPRRRDFVTDYVRACGVDEADVLRWEEVWRELATRRAQPMTQSPAQPSASGGRLRRSWNWLTAIIGLLVLASAIAGMWQWTESHCGTTNSTLHTSGDDGCVGVTDGSHIFDRELARVSKLILTENRRAESSRRGYVTLAYLGPLTSTEERVQNGAVHQLEGAFTAQVRANREAGGGPMIRLLLANEGESQSEWRRVVTRLVDMKKAPDRLVAVVGLGPGTASTFTAARQLARAGIPMVADSINLDGFDSTAFRGLTRVTPPISSEVSDIARYISTRPWLRTATLVTTSNKNDLYASSLANEFRTQFSKYLKAGRSVEFGLPDDADIPPTVTSNLFTAELCDVKPDMAFYAGRADALPGFLSALNVRPCKDDPLTVITTTNAALTLDAADLKDLAPHTTVIFADSRMAAGLNSPTGAAYQEFVAHFRRLFPMTDLADGRAVMAHDAVTAAATAINRAAAAAHRRDLESAAVMKQLYAGEVIEGAGGRFEITRTGNPSGAPAPIVELGRGAGLAGF